MLCYNNQRRVLFDMKNNIVNKIVYTVGYFTIFIGFGWVLWYLFHDRIWLFYGLIAIAALGVALLYVIALLVGNKNPKDADDEQPK